jgi:hypothetical protein
MRFDSVLPITENEKHMVFGFTFVRSKIVKQDKLCQLIGMWTKTYPYTYIPVPVTVKLQSQCCDRLWA